METVQNRLYECLEEDDKKYYDDIQKLKSTIITYENFPKPGVTYKDAFSVLKHADTFQITINMFCDVISKCDATAIVALESRGFILGGAIAYKLNLPMVPIRKPNKLPGPVRSVGYSLHYGSDILQIQDDVLKPGDRVVLVDDAVATGGSLKSAIELVEAVGGVVVHNVVIIGLQGLGWEKRLEGYPLTSLFYL